MVVGGLLAGGQAVLNARERAHEARFDDVAGVLPPMPEKLRALWTASADGGRGPLDGTFDVEGHAVAVSTDGASYTIRSIDRTTGRDAWTVTGRIDLPEKILDAHADCLPLEVDAQIACVVEPAGVGPEPGHPIVVVIDAATGVVIDRRSLDEELWAAGGGAIVTATSRTTDDRLIWTIDARDAKGARLWHRTLDPVTRSRSDRTLDDEHFDETALHVSGSRVVLTSSGVVRWLDDGVVKAESDLPRDTSTLLVNGALVRISMKTTDMGGGTSVESPTAFALQPMGRAPAPIGGTPVRPAVDDGSANDLVLVRDTSGLLTARDARTGRVRWATPKGLDGALILDGTVYQVAGDPSLELVARDADTGDVRWSHELAQSGWNSFQTLATDGRNVYAVEAGVVLPFRLEDGGPQPERKLPFDPTTLPGLTADAAHGVLLVTPLDANGNPTETTAIG